MVDDFSNKHAKLPATRKPSAGPRSPRWRNLGDLACCALVIVAAIAGYVVIGWALWQMPALR